VPKLAIKAGTTSKLVDVFIQDSSSGVGAGLTGLAFGTASLTCYYYREGAGSAVQISLLTMTLGTWTTSGFIVVDGTNMPGVYQLGVPDAAFAAGAKSVVIMLKGAANMAPCVLEIELTAVDNQSATAFITGVNSLAPPTNWNSMVIDGSGRVDVSKVSGTSQTARDLGASVLLSAGTGTGQLDFTSGVVKANLAQILGTALTETAGLIAAGFKQFFNISSPTSTMNLVTAVGTLTTYTGNTVQTGDSFARLGAAGAGLTALGDTRIAHLDADISTRTKPADTQAAVTSLTNAPTAGDFTATMKTSLNAATPAVTVSDKTGFALTSAYDPAKTASQAGDAMALTSGERTTLTGVVWTAATRTLTSFGTLAADAATAVWASVARTLSAFGFTVATTDAIPTAVQNATALLTTDLTGVSGEASHSVLNMLRGLGTRNKVTVDYTGNTISVYKEDGVTLAYTVPITTATGITKTITGVTP
jgi:hypothetical protein